MENWVAASANENFNLDFMHSLGSNFVHSVLNQQINENIAKPSDQRFSQQPQCNLCWTILQDSYYEKSGMALCKDCYCRTVSKEECHKCKTVISNSEMVMKCNGVFFHWQCFLCSVCGTKLEEGQKYGVMGGIPFCEQHFIAATHDLKKEKERGESQRTENDFLAYFCYSLEQTLYRSNLFQTENTPDFQIDALSDSTRGYLSLEIQQYDCGIQNEALEPHIALDRNNVMLPGQVKGRSSFMSRGKRKRHRTTFRQDQLKEMKAVFERNPNPDTAELQRLSQRLGLSKRVLQVWFQNARAKQRRCLSISQEEFV